MRISLIVAAGGTGSRFSKAQGKKGPTKLFHELDSKPVLVHALAAFREVPEIKEKLLVVPAALRSSVRAILREHALEKSVKLVPGGSTRAESVYKGLRASDPKNDWVMVHDGARPFVSVPALRDLMNSGADGADGAILASPMTATVKAVEAGTSDIEATVDRSRLFMAETPQLARRKVLIEAYKRKGSLDATDEASLLESVGGRVKIVTHQGWNPKITTPRDLELAEAWLKKNKVQRTGFGRDTHRLVKGRKFWLGGIRVPFDRGPLGHSDGDALLHAVVDAMLGAAGKGDIGDWFSDKSKAWKNAPSSKFVTTVVAELAKEGWKPEHVDTVIILERPKLGAYKQKMKQKLAQLLGIPEENVSIKAKTAEGLGPEGEGLAISCEALVTMAK
jgi:2-C-methyl-D-erythritol 4-phosphate cytidylyltransferase/2-C-methyl-D-erythritol 2,4-cyclodiphosphate synthase